MAVPNHYVNGSGPPTVSSPQVVATPKSIATQTVRRKPVARVPVHPVPTDLPPNPLQQTQSISSVANPEIPAAYANGSEGTANTVQAPIPTSASMYTPLEPHPQHPSSPGPVPLSRQGTSDYDPAAKLRPRLSGGSSSITDFQQHSNVSGCFYVHELRRRSATVWCDIPATVWGIPIGIAENTNRKSLPVSARAMAAQRRTMDIRHSHLTPRLLASEAADDDEPSSPNVSRSGSTASGGVIRPFNSASAAVSLYGSGGTGTEDTMSIRSGPSKSSSLSQFASVASDGPSQSSGNSPKQQAYPTRSRSGSESSVKSIEEGTQKIRLFVANPDSDSD